MGAMTFGVFRADYFVRFSSHIGKGTDEFIVTGSGVGWVTRCRIADAQVVASPIVDIAIRWGSAEGRMVEVDAGINDADQYALTLGIHTSRGFTIPDGRGTDGCRTLVSIGVFHWGKQYLDTGLGCQASGLFGGQEHGEAIGGVAVAEEHFRGETQHRVCRGEKAGLFLLEESQVRLRSGAFDIQFGRTKNRRRCGRKPGDAALVGGKRFIGQNHHIAGLALFVELQLSNSCFLFQFTADAAGLTFRRTLHGCPVSRINLAGTSWGSTLGSNRARDQGEHECHCD